MKEGESKTKVKQTKLAINNRMAAAANLMPHMLYVVAAPLPPACRATDSEIGGDRISVVIN